MLSRLEKFLKQLAAKQMKIIILKVHANDLPSKLQELREKYEDFHNLGQFDRIDASNRIDLSQLGLHGVLPGLSDLLKTPDQNKHATLIRCFRTAITHTDQLDPDHPTADQYNRYFNDVQPYLDFDPFNDPTHAVSMALKLMDAIRLVWDKDQLFDRHAKILRFDDMARRADMIEKTRNTVVAEWPLSNFTSQLEFDLLLGSAHTGNERYVEWQRKRDDNEL